MNATLLLRFALFAACGMFVACAADPGPRTGTSTSSKLEKRKKKQKKKKKQRKTITKPRSADEVIIVDEADADTDAAEQDELAKERAARKRRIAERAKKAREAEERAEKERAERARARREQKERARREQKERERREQKERARREQKERERREQKERERVAREEAAEKADEEAAQDAAEQAEREREAQDAARDAELEAAAEEEAADVDDREIDMSGEEEDPLGERVAAIDDDEDEQPDAAAATGAQLAINDRPLTIAKQRLEVHGGLRVSAVTLPGPMPGTEVSASSTGLALGATYGIDDKLEVGGDYVPSLDPGSAKGPLTLRAAYTAIRTPKLDVALAGGIAFDFVATTDPMTMTSTSSTFASLQLGVWARYRLDKRVSLFTGLPALPPSSVGLSNATLPLPPFMYQLGVGLNNSGPIAFEVPIGFGFQVRPNIYAFGSLELAHIGLANTDSAFVFADFFPLALGGLYTRGKLDLGVVFSDDFKQGFDYLRLDAVIRYMR